MGEGWDEEGGLEKKCVSRVHRQVLRMNISYRLVPLSKEPLLHVHAQRTDQSSIIMQLCMHMYTVTACLH